MPLSFGNCPTLEHSSPNFCEGGGHEDTSLADEPDMPDFSRTRFDDLWPQNQSKSLTRPRFWLRQVPTAADRTPTPPPGSPALVKELMEVMKMLRYTIPPSVDANASMRDRYISFVLDEYEVLRIRKFFQPPPAPMRGALIARMRNSSSIIWFMYLGARIFQALSGTADSAVVQPYVYWIDKFDQQATNSLCRNPSVDELGDRLAGLLELVFLKFVAVNSCAGYSLLRRSLPTFFQLVAADSSLWSERQGLLVSFPRALATQRYEIRRFVFYDTMIAFILGLPPLVEYDLSEFPIISELAQPLEWVHGIPAELLVNIVQVNAWRTVYPGVANATGWVDLETRTLAWEAKAEEIRGDDSFGVVTRLAVQESWRHAVLVYIYMRDFLVMVTDVVVRAGLAAQYEHQRAIVRDKLDSFCDTRVWLCRGPDLALVLDHLWHGVARDGARAHITKVAEQLFRLLPAAERIKTQVILLAGSTTPFRNDTDRELTLRQESNFFYLTGCDVPNSHVLVTARPPSLSPLANGTITATGGSIHSTLFLPREDPLETMWSPPPPTLQAARETHDVHEVAYTDEFTAKITSTVQEVGSAVIHIIPHTAQFPNIPAPVLTALAVAGLTPPPITMYLLPALHSARLTKTPYEIELIRKANAISSRAHEVIMRVLGKDMKEVGGKVSTNKVTTAVMPGQWRIEKEAEAEAVFVASCRREGAVHQAYMPIVASAQHAATLHYCCNDRAFAWGPINSERGDLATQQTDSHEGHSHSGITNGHQGEPTLAPQVLLLDAGCEWRNYASDITRTTPVGNGGRFTPEARAIYQLVLKMQNEAIDSLKPGLHWDTVHLQCHQILVDGFLKLGIFKGDATAVLDSEISSAFYPHGVGHSLGLDVHDVPSASKPESHSSCGMILSLGPNVTHPTESIHHPSFYKYLRLRLPLVAGMVVTVEPGIYFSPHLLAPVRNSPYIDHEVLAKYESVGGVRIEDVVVITENACENLTTVGKDVDWIERLSSGEA
ncbi:hypothetical protein FRC10_012117 [Ceratobasidium sp. 414]|nr:hypothetical protein FRC10_012117 [Ceratobasidium sp. 414]